MQPQRDLPSDCHPRRIESRFHNIGPEEQNREHGEPDHHTRSELFHCSTSSRENKIAHTQREYGQGFASTFSAYFVESAR
jgi:hypothetical protein